MYVVCMYVYSTEIKQEFFGEKRPMTYFTEDFFLHVVFA